LQLIHNQNFINSKNEYSIKSNIKYLEKILELLIEIPELRNSLLLTLNQSIVRKGKNIAFIFNERNEETFQLIENVEVINYILQLFEEKNEITFGDFINILDDENAEEFTLQLLDLGVLSFHFPFQKNHDAFDFLKKMLDNIHPKITEEDSLNAYNQVLSTLQSIDNQDIIPFFDLKPEQQYFFDSTVNQLELHELGQRFEKHFSSVADLTTQLLAIVTPLHVNFFKSNIDNFLEKSSKKELDLTTLYKEIFHKKNNFILDENPKIKDLKEMISIWCHDEQIINISSEKIAKLHKYVTSNFETYYDNASPSLNIVLQPFVEDTLEKSVLNGISIGFGKQFARYIDLYDDEISNDFLENNKNSDTILAELNDNSFFNGNLHPSLFEFSISTPNTMKINDLELSIADLIVKKIDHKWVLFHKKMNKRVIPIDFGIEHPSYRSPMYQLLNYFSYRVPNFRIINENINSNLENKKQLPRIIVDNQLIIQRKTWFYEVKELPFLKKNETEIDYIERVQIWQNEQKLPKVVFVSIPRFQPEDLEINTEAKPQKDDYKPQMIDFQNPLLILLFSKIIQKVPSQMIIEEMLPSENEIFTIEEKKYILEVVIQSDKI
jgi:hypothetical protein